MLKHRIKEIIKQTLNIVWVCTPAGIKNWVKKKHDDKAAQQEMELYLSTKVSEQDVADAFEALGIDGDVMVHSSLVHIGNIKGKHKPIILALQKHVIDKGNTILAIAIPVKGSTEDYLRNITKFDRDAPIGMGVISTYYAKQEEAKRSLEPTHSVVALGPRAEEYTASHHIDNTPFTKNSPFYKLLENNGSVLMIGAGIKHLTLCHIIEDMLGDLYPQRVYTRKDYAIDIYKDGQCIHHGLYKAHSKWGSTLRVPDYVQAQIKHLPSTKVVPLGGAELLYINARDAVICELQELRKGNSIYGYRYINAKCKQAIDQWIQTINKMPI